MRFPSKPAILPIIILVFHLFQFEKSFGQYLSNLQATKDDALFTTYAAPIRRSEYTIDQAYRLMWYDENRNVEFISKDGGNFGSAFLSSGKLCSTLAGYYKEPVVTTSYPDLVKMFFYPFSDLRVEAFFDVYSSASAIVEYKITNESHQISMVSILPYFSFDGKTENPEIFGNTFSGTLHKKRDSWMIEHNIPYEENLKSILAVDFEPESYGSYVRFPEKTEITNLKLNNRVSDNAHFFVFIKMIFLNPGETKTFRMIRSIGKEDIPIEKLVAASRNLFKTNLEEQVKSDENLFDKIPKLKFANKDHEAIYWNSFSLIRQCMMPPEGACQDNYYVFSREPKWGWGYGGQVFHESLVMLAYVFMDPQSAMNSQRVYMKRQQPSGYINYRTGPYLDERIETNGQLTSSAPWYNWQNLEIYKVSRDKKFLNEAYNSGKKFYNYYVSNRDTDKDGLCEWGADAVLESVRDARVAVWDKVGWPSNFEGPDLNAMLVSEAKSLAYMAKELGLNNESSKWNEDANKRISLINRKLWDERSGFYFNVKKENDSFTFKDSDDLKIKEIIGFLPLWADVPDTIKTKILMKSLTNPDEFWRNYGVPTLSAKDDYYNPIGYWNGPVWVQWNYLIFRGLLDYGYYAEAEELSDRVMLNIAYHLKKDHVFWEFYSADDLQAGWNQTYIWAGIAARFFIDLQNARPER